MGKTTPKYHLEGGPLAGQDREKHLPGRWPSYLDGDGEPVPTSKIQKFRITDAPTRFPMFRLYALDYDTTDLSGDTVTMYHWLGQ